MKYKEFKKLVKVEHERSGNPPHDIPKVTFSVTRTFVPWGMWDLSTEELDEKATRALFDDVKEWFRKGKGVERLVGWGLSECGAHVCPDDVWSGCDDGTYCPNCGRIVIDRDEYRFGVDE